MKSLEYVKFDGKLFAIVVRSEYRAEGISFFTEAQYSQQLGYMNRPKGYLIPPHIHQSTQREVFLTQETLFIRSGKVRIDFYSPEKRYLESLILEAGDVILLSNGGHGFEILEDAEIIEVKQGPFVGENDKVRFEAVLPPNLIFNQYRKIE